MDCVGGVLIEPFVMIIAKSPLSVEKRLHALTAIKLSVCCGHCDGAICDRWDSVVMAGRVPEGGSDGHHKAEDRGIDS